MQYAGMTCGTAAVAVES